MSSLPSSSSTAGSVPSVSQIAFQTRVAVVAALVPLLVRLPLPRLARLLEPRRRPERTAAELSDLANRVDKALLRAPRVVRRGCLTRGVTLYYFLRRAGADVSLAFGMSKNGEPFVGHCWLVEAGEPFLERKDPREKFTEVYRIPYGARPAHR
jgi:transglutaminase superfamily protein